MQVLLSYYTRLLKVKIILNSSRNKKINKKNNNQRVTQNEWTATRYLLHSVGL